MNIMTHRDEEQNVFKIEINTLTHLENILFTILELKINNLIIVTKKILISRTCITNGKSKIVICLKNSFSSAELEFVHMSVKI